jgi:hypothetical protein
MAYPRDRASDNDPAGDVLNGAAAARAVAATASNIESDEPDANAEDLAAKETREKIEMFAWADSVLDLGGADLEAAVEAAVKRFVGRPREMLLKLIESRRAARDRAGPQPRAGPQDHGDRTEDTRKYYGVRFAASDHGLFCRGDNDAWEQIAATRIDLVGLSRDACSENWGTCVCVRNRDGVRKLLTVPYALIAAGRAKEIAAMLGSRGALIVSTTFAHRSLLEFLALEVPGRITTEYRAGWYHSGGAWCFVVAGRYRCAA